jgi:hypothetical protein
MMTAHTAMTTRYATTQYRASDNLFFEKRFQVLDDSFPLGVVQLLEH